MPKQVNENSECTDEDTMSNGIHEVSPDQGHTLPILKKIIDLSTKIQVKIWKKKKISDYCFDMANIESYIYFF